MIKRVLADDGALRVANDFLESTLGFGDGATGEFREERGRFADAPAGVNRHEQIVAVWRERFVELALEILDALVELVDFLNRPRRLRVKSRLGDLSRRLAERRHDRYLRRAHLEQER